VDFRCGHWLTYFVHLSDYPVSSQPRAPPSYLERRIVRDDNGDNQQKAVLQDTPTDDDARIDAIPGPGNQERFDEEVMIYYKAIDSSLASQFLNLDDQASDCTDQTMTTDTQSPVAPFCTPTCIAMGGALGWRTKPAFRFTTSVETVIDLDGGEKTVPWPWGDHTYRPPTPPMCLGPEECAIEYRLMEIEEELREELMEAMAQDAIVAGKRTAIQSQMGEKWRAASERGQPAIVAFDNQVVRGRTIYNP
jgi:hypothetical protein